MQGPFDKETCTKVSAGTDWEQCLKRGQRYRVVKLFCDFDGDVHSVGEEWRFIGSSFLPHDDGLSIFVADDDESEWHIRLCWRPNEQQQICENFRDYVEPVATDHLNL